MPNPNKVRLLAERLFEASASHDIDDIARFERIVREELKTLLAAGDVAQDAIFIMIRWAEEGQTPNELARMMKADIARKLRAELAQWKGERK